MPGRIDRIDHLPDGTPLVLDYKTEASSKTASRIKEPLEDTQMAFYAALLPNDTLQGAYVNVGERDGTRTYAQPELLEARDALVEGILNDIGRIADGQRRTRSSGARPASRPTPTPTAGCRSQERSAA